MTILTLQPDAAAGEDVLLIQSSASNNYGILNEIRAGMPADSTVAVSALKFNLSSIPAGATIDSAILSLYCIAELNTTDVLVSLNRSLVQWWEGVKNGSAPDAGQDGSTFNSRNVNGSLSWPTALSNVGDTTSTWTPTSSSTITGTGSFFDWDVESDVQGFVSGSLTNHGWFIKKNGAIVASSLKTFASSDHATAAQRPKLVVNYSFYIAGTASGTSTIVAIIEADGKLVGTILGTSVTTAILLSNEFLRAATSGTSTATASLDAAGYMASVVAGTSTAIGNIQGEQQIAGTAAGTSTATGNPKGIFRVEGTSDGTSTASALPSFEGILRGFSTGVATVSGSMWGKANGKAIIIGCNPVPLLYITDGSIKINGQLNILNFLSEGSGFKLREDGWRPQIAQYKEGGRFSNGPLAQGRRLRYRNFDNVIDTFSLAAVSHDQDALIEYQQELLAWQEYAADYWVSDYVVSPVYLVARAARETNIRYAIIHMISVPELENPYTQPFYGRQNSAFSSLTPRIERGHWLSKPPGEIECVPISSIRSWTVSGWGVGV